MASSVLVNGQNFNKKISISKLDYQPILQSKFDSYTPKYSYNGKEKNEGLYTPKVRALTSPEEDQIGTTTYDLQTYSSTCRRLHYDYSGTLHGTWTMSFLENGSMADLATGYNNNSSGSWGTEPTENLVPSEITGWSNIVAFEDGTVGVLAIHDGIDLLLSKKTGSTWESTFIPQSQDVNPYVPRVGQSGDVINLICTNFSSFVETGTGLLFNRSEDQGETWQGYNVVQEVYDHFPFYPSGSNDRTIAFDSYAMDAQGDVIAFVLGDYGRQTVLFKSTDAGQTWQTTIISSTTDPFETDLSQFQATWCAGDLSLVLDDDGMAHVAFNGIWNSYNSDFNGIFFTPDFYDIIYWNETMETDGYMHVPGTVNMELDGDGSIALPSGFNSGVNFQYYGPSLMGHTSLGFGEDGTLYLAYDNTRDVSNLFGLSIYRDIYLMKFDGEWSGPINITDAGDSEDVFPHLPRRIIGNEVPILWQQDNLPSMIVSNSPQGETTVNNIKVEMFDSNLIEDPTYIPENNTPFANFNWASYTTSIGCGLSLFDLGTIILDFPDGELGAEATVLEGVDFSTAGSYVGFYITTDTDGNELIDTVVVSVLADEIAPSLTIVEDTIVLEPGSIFDPYEDLNVSIFDPDSYCFAEEFLIIDGEVDTEVPGIYTIIITVVDGAGNVSETGTVVVIIEEACCFEITVIVNGETVNDGEQINLEGGLNVTQEDILEIEVFDQGDAEVTVIGEIDPATPGSYEITVEVIFPNGSSSTSTITVLIEDTTDPDFNYAGPQEIITCQGEEFDISFEDIEALFELSDNFIVEGDFSGISWEGEVVNSISGIYPVDYTAADPSGNESTLTINFVVLDETDVLCISDQEAPVVTFTYDGMVVTELTLEGGTDATLLDIIAIVTDNEDADADLDGPNGDEVDIAVVGTYTISYTATDESNNEETYTLVVTVEDTTAPYLQLLGDALVETCIGDEFDPTPENVEQLFEISDNFAVAAVNVDFDAVNVNTDSEGDYAVDYTATDGSGNVSDPVTITYRVGNPVQCWDVDAGIEDLNLANAMNVSPNPTSGNILLSVDPSMGEISIEMFDVTGKSLKNFSKFQAGNINLDLSGFAHGVYYIQVSTTDAIAVEKVVVK